MNKIHIFNDHQLGEIFFLVVSELFFSALRFTPVKSIVKRQKVKEEEGILYHIDILKSQERKKPKEQKKRTWHKL